MTTQADSQSLINEVINFYGTYLCCSREQLDILALWTLHTHCFEDAPFSPALNIHSRHKQSGKTRCLELLDALCYRSWFHTSPSPALVVRQTQGFDEDNPFKGTLLLDDCHFSTVLQGVLSASFRWYGAQIARDKNENGDWEFGRHPTFFPKAFAGNCRLPDCLRDISIPIALEPKAPDFPCRRFKIGHKPLFEISFTLRNKLYEWGLEHAPKLINTPAYGPSQLPPELSSRQQDCAEPLLQIADLIGGDWPQRASVALVNAFALGAFEDFHSSKQVLIDIYDLFTAKDNPGWISTVDLLAHLHVLDDRSWDEWSKGKPMNSKDLAALLAPFGIKSRNHRTSEGDKVAKGYNLADLLASGQCHILPELFRRSREEMLITAPECDEVSLGDGKNVAADLPNSTVSAPKPVAVLSCQARAAGSRQLAGSSVAADSQDSSLTELDPGVVLSRQPKKADSVAAELQNQNQPCGTTAGNPRQLRWGVGTDPDFGEGIQRSQVAVAANQ